MYNNNNNTIVWLGIRCVLSSSPRNNYVVTVANDNNDNINNWYSRVPTSGS